MERMTRSPARMAAVRTEAQATLTVRTPGAGFSDLTRQARAFLAEIQAASGLLVVFCRHTSASLTIQENADPDVRTDLLAALDRLAPQDFGWVHALEGPDDMPAHVRTALTDTSLAIPVRDGAPALGTWQAVYLIEHRAHPHAREVIFSFIGQTKLDEPACNPKQGV